MNEPITPTIGIFGTSGMAREVGDIAWALGYSALYIARSELELEAWHYPDQVVLENDTSKFKALSCIIGIGDNTIRKKIAKRFSTTVNFCNLIHPTATFGRDQIEVIEASQGTIICAGARFTSNIQIGDFNIVNQNATIAHDCIIGSYVHIASGANLSGSVCVQNECWIGAGAVINQGATGKRLTINKLTIVGSGAVVTGDCASNATYAGVPAKRIK